ADPLVGQSLGEEFRDIYLRQKNKEWQRDFYKVTEEERSQMMEYIGSDFSGPARRALSFCRLSGAKRTSGRRFDLKTAKGLWIQNLALGGLRTSTRTEGGMHAGVMKFSLRGWQEVMTYYIWI